MEVLSGALPQWPISGLDNFEDAAAPDRWTAGTGIWEIGMPTSGPAANAGGNRAHEGTNVLATILSGNYTDDRSSRIVSPAFTVPVADQNPRLRFWHWWSISSNDFGKVQISTDDGVTWQDLSGQYTADSSGQWTRAVLDLSAYAGQSVRIGFYFEAHGNSCYSGTSWCTNVGPGWYIDEVMIEIDPDTVAPETTIISGPADASCITTTSVTISWSGSDNYAGTLTYSYKMDGNEWSLFDPATSISFDNLFEGTHIVSVKAQDQAGNEDPTPVVRSFMIDSLVPVISGIQADPTIDSAIITWTTNEPASSQIEYGDTADYGFTIPVSTSLVTNHDVPLTGLNQNATYHYRVKSRDECGNEVVSSDLTFATVVDVTPPDTLFTAGPPNNGKSCDLNVYLCWQGIDDLTASSDIQYSFSLDNGLWSDWSTETCNSFNGLADGLHTVLVKAKDSSGNTDATPAALNFNVDMEIPALSNIASSPRDYSAVITWNTSEPATAQVEYGETAAYGMTSPPDTSMTGAHTITIDGLTPNTMYHYRVKSSDGCREVVSDDMTFTTTDILYPNLHVMQIDMPATVKALEQVNFRWLVRNNGPGSAQGNWSDKVFLSGDEILDSQDTLLGEFNFSDGMVWETERWRATTLDMPTMPAGTYYIIVQTDANNGIIESNENDNSLTKRIDYLKVKQLAAAPDQIAVQLVPGEIISGSIDLINLVDTALTGITATVQGNSPNISIQATPPSSVDGKTVHKISYSVTASDDSVTSNVPVLMFSSAEGESAGVTFNITVNPGHPNLVSNPGYLEQTMVRGAQTFVEFEIMNNGSAAVNNLKILLPPTDWLSLVTPDNIISLGRGEKTRVSLALKPLVDLPLGPYTGNLSLSADNASANLDFRFTAVSDKIGGLKIIAKDEFTYFAADHPPVSGAAVKISNPYDGTVIAEGITDADGQFAINDLFEGLYRIEVSAEKHGTFNAIVQIDPGQIREITAFLPRQLVTYSWRVVPVQTEDKYIVTLEAVFETHVPAPVITVEPAILDLSKLQYDADGRAIVNYTVTNHGLIAANGATIRFGSHPDYEMMAISENIGEVPPMTSMVIPVEVSKMSSASARSSADCGIPVVVDYYYVCENNQWRRVNVYAVTGNCPSSATPSISTGYGGFGGGGNGGSGGGGGTHGGYLDSTASINGPWIQQDATCSACDFSSGPGAPERCFGALGNGCNDDAPGGIPPFIYHEDTCYVDGYWSEGSKHHDRCCLENRTGFGCNNYWNPFTPCYDEFKEAFNDVIFKQYYPATYGPYPVGNTGDHIQ